MENVIAVIIIVVIIGLAALYVYKAKKNGVKCIGCPHGSVCAGKTENKGACSGNCSCCSGCCNAGSDEE